jgi:hypothetical protein
MSAPRIANTNDLEHQRAKLLAQERRRPGQWHWLSFANKRGFLGAAVVWARGIETAVQRARDLRISRGFRGNVEVFCEPIPASIIRTHVPPDLRNRLLAEGEVLQRLEGQRVPL